jgi:hypothetical protein
MIWVLIAVLAIGTIALKIAGPVIAGRRQPPAPLTRVIGLLTSALLTSLVISSTFGDGQQLTVDARAAGLVLGAILLVLRAPSIVAQVVAAAACAALRAFGRADPDETSSARLGHER